jgi:hypothetical protein
VKTLLVVWGLTCGGDALTTNYIMRTGGREAWLPTQNPAVATTIAGGTCAAGLVGVSQLAKEHPKAAKFIGWTIVGVRGSIVVSNLNQIRQHNGRR